ncbi:MAG TPA: hypothetical protein VMM13_12640 [Euzebya sp.]|nr:hypothetical protein [Euzebya sp.]
MTVPPAEEDDGLAGGTTPCSTIVISSDSWGPGTEVTAIRNDPGDEGAEQTDCAEDTSTTVGLTGTEDAAGFAEEVSAPQLPGDDTGGSSTSGSSTSGSGAQLGTATADDRGRLTLTIQIPADAGPGAFAYTLVGTAASGEVREVAERITIAPLADDFSSVDATVLPTSGVAVWQLVAGLVLIVALGFAFFGGPLSLRRRRG